MFSWLWCCITWQANLLTESDLNYEKSVLKMLEGQHYPPILVYGTSKLLVSIKISCHTENFKDLQGDAFHQPRSTILSHTVRTWPGCGWVWCNTQANLAYVFSSVKVHRYPCKFFLKARFSIKGQKYNENMVAFSTPAEPCKRSVTGRFLLS